MKKLLLILAIGTCAISVRAADLTATQTQKAQPAPRRVIIPQQQGEGAVQRGIRSGNPVQMISVFAPIEYGDGSEFVYYDENDPFQHHHPGTQHAKGIKLFGFTF